jgi:hypothetical protein
MKFLQLILCKVFGLTLELKSRVVSKRVLFEITLRACAVEGVGMLQPQHPPQVGVAYGQVVGKPR